MVAQTVVKLDSPHDRIKWTYILSWSLNSWHRKNNKFPSCNPESNNCFWRMPCTCIYIFNMVWCIWIVSHKMALRTPRNSRNSQDIECICVTTFGISIVDVNPNRSSLCWNRFPNPALSAEEFQKRQVLETKRLWGNLGIICTWTTMGNSGILVYMCMMNLIQFHLYDFTELLLTCQHVLGGHLFEIREVWRESDKEH